MMYLRSSSSLFRETHFLNFAFLQCVMLQHWMPWVRNRKLRFETAALGAKRQALGGAETRRTATLTKATQNTRHTFLSWRIDSRSRRVHHIYRPNSSKRQHRTTEINSFESSNTSSLECRLELFLAAHNWEKCIFTKMRTVVICVMNAKYAQHLPGFCCLNIYQSTCNAKRFKTQKHLPKFVTASKIIALRK